MSTTWGAPSGSSGPPGPGGRTARRSGGLLAGLVSFALVLLVVGGAALWEQQTRSNAARPFVEALESQQYAMNGADVRIAASGGFVGTSAALDALDGTHSRIEVAATVKADTIDDFEVEYALIGAPVSGTGTIEAVELTTSLPAESVVAIVYGQEVTEEGRTVSYRDGRFVIETTTADGVEIVVEFDMRVFDGQFRREPVVATNDGVDVLNLVDNEPRIADWCEGTGLESELQELTITDDALIARWRIEQLDVDDLALAICLG